MMGASGGPDDATPGSARVVDESGNNGGCRSSARPAPGAQAAAAPPAAGALPLQDFQPRSMLVVPETRVERARFPVVDVHVHPTSRVRRVGGVPHGEAVRHNATPADLLALMARRNLRTLVSLTGGVGAGLADSVRTFQQPHPDRFVVFTEPSYDRIAEPGYAKWQADELARAKQAGARGVKILKVLGLFLREQVSSGPLVKIDDPRFDPMWEACGALGLPIAIHVSDPTAFFLPIDAHNERYEELQRHPDWSFHGRDYPSDAELLAARDRVLARHPKTTFIGLHVGHSSENLAAAAAALDRFPNLHVEIAARIGELGRQPRASQTLLRSVPGQDPVRHRRPAGRALSDLLPVPRDRGRVLRLRERAGPRAGALADLRAGAERRDPEEGLLGQRRAAALAAAGQGVTQHEDPSHYPVRMRCCVSFR